MTPSDFYALPENVQNILNKETETYQDCEEIKAALEKVGYTCDYGLDAIVYEVKKLP